MVTVAITARGRPPKTIALQVAKVFVGWLICLVLIQLVTLGMFTINHHTVDKDFGRGANGVNYVDCTQREIELDVTGEPLLFVMFSREKSLLGRHAPFPCRCSNPRRVSPQAPIAISTCLRRTERSCTSGQQHLLLLEMMRRGSLANVPTATFALFWSYGWRCHCFDAPVVYDVHPHTSLCSCGCTEIQ